MLNYLYAMKREHFMLFAKTVNTKHWEVKAIKAPECCVAPPIQRKRRVAYATL
jgi:hypothetical protein